MGQQEPSGTSEAEGSSRHTIRAEHRALLAQLSELADVRLELREESSEAPAGGASARILAGDEPTGWLVIAEGQGARHRLAAQLASEVLGARLAGPAQRRAPSRGRLRQDRRLDFLYETSQRVGGLLDEQKICDFVVREAADLLECGRASIMLLDPESNTLKIRSSVGVPEHIADDTVVRPGERISGKVFASGQQLLVREGDPMPSESLGVRELRNSPSFLSVPLTIPDDYGAERQIVGVINLTRKTGGGAFTASDVRLVQTVAAHTAAQVNLCRLLTAERERRRLEHELEIAAEIQLSLLPEKPLSAGSFRAAGVCRPAERIGGDFFDYWHQQDRVCLLVADVTGHDLGAALLASAFRSVVRAESAHRQSVAQMISQVNRAFCGDLTRAEMQITLCYLEVNLERNLLTYCCCGHPHPLLLRKGRSTWLQEGGMVIGVEEGATFEEESLPLMPADRLIVYTDGVVEAGVHESRPFEREGLLAAVREGEGLGVAHLARHIVRAVERHVGEGELRDDTTVLVAGFSGPESET